MARAEKWFKSPETCFCLEDLMDNVPVDLDNLSIEEGLKEIQERGNLQVKSHHLGNLTHFANLVRKVRWISASDIGSDVLRTFPHLQELNISNTGVGDAILKNLPLSLRVLNIRNTGIKEGAIESLKESIPGIEIQRSEMYELKENIACDNMGSDGFIEESW